MLFWIIFTYQFFSFFLSSSTIFSCHRIVYCIYIPRNCFETFFSSNIIFVSSFIHSRLKMEQGGLLLISSKTNISRNSTRHCGRINIVFLTLSKAQVVNSCRNYRYSLAVGFIPSRATIFGLFFRSSQWLLKLIKRLRIFSKIRLTCVYQKSHSSQNIAFLYFIAASVLNLF